MELQSSWHWFCGVLSIELDAERRFGSFKEDRLNETLWGLGLRAQECLETGSESMSIVDHNI